jgi:enolase
VDFAAVKAKNDENLLKQWRQARRYDGKGCMEAVKHIETVLAKAFTGKRLAQLGSLLEVDRELLRLELDQALAAGILSSSASAEDKIHVMQRKGVLGMNAILSMSLALGRALAASQGKELWQLIRGIAHETMAKFVAANAKTGEKLDLAALKATDFEELKAKFKNCAQAAVKENKKIYVLLRQQMPVYPV